MNVQLFNPFAVEAHEFSTRLGPAVCRARLEDRLLSEEAFRDWRPGDLRLLNQVMGDASTRGFQLRRLTRYYQPLAMEVWGEFVPAPVGTRVRAYLALRPRVAAFFLAWFLFLLAVQITLLLDPGAADTRLLSTLGRWLPTILLAAGGAVYLMDRTRARQDALTLLAFLREALQANEGPTDQVPGRVAPP